MYAPRPIITRLDGPAEILSLELIKEFIGLDSDIDAEQDKVLPVLRSAAIEQGEQITGIVWGAATYRINTELGPCRDSALALPLSPALSVEQVVFTDATGVETLCQPEAYTFITSDLSLGRPWALLVWKQLPPVDAANMAIEFTAGWTANALPDSIRNWALLRIATLYDRRTDLPDSITNMELPRYHALGLLDRWTVRGAPNG